MSELKLNELQIRCNKFIEELGVPLTRFCKNFNLSTQSFYRWCKGEQNLKQERQEEIDEYLKKYNF